MLRQIATRFGQQTFEVVENYYVVLSMIAFALIVHCLPVRWKEYYRGIFISTPLVVKLLAAVLVAIAIFQVKSADLQPFIYFRF